MKLKDVAVLLIAGGGPQGDVIKRSDRVWRGMWAGLLQDTRLRGVLLVFAPRPGVRWELCRCGRGMCGVGRPAGAAPSPPAASGGPSTVSLVIGIIAGVLCIVCCIAAGACFYKKKKQTLKVVDASVVVS